MKYKFIEDLTSDVMFEAYGKTLEELFANAAEAMFSVICKLEKVKPKKKKDVRLDDESVEKLLISWLQHLISMVDVDEMFFSQFEVDSVRPSPDSTRDKQLWNLEAKVYGQAIKPELGETVVKAVTNYKFRFRQTKSGYSARVSLDI